MQLRYSQPHNLTLKYLILIVRHPCDKELDEQSYLRTKLQGLFVRLERSASSRIFPAMLSWSLKYKPFHSFLLPAPRCPAQTREIPQGWTGSPGPWEQDSQPQELALGYQWACRAVVSRSRDRRDARCLQSSIICIWQPIWQGLLTLRAS